MWYNKSYLKLVINNETLHSEASAKKEIAQTGRVICHHMTKFKFKKLLVKYNRLNE